MTHQFLFEIGCEEIPARFVRNAAKQFTEKTAKWFEEQRISFEEIQTFATPRRLTVAATGVAAKQNDQVELLRGPAAKIAKTEDGSWSKAALGFARKNGVDPISLELREEKGTEYIYAVKQVIGQGTQEVIAHSFSSVLESLTFPKTMRWEATKTKFIRPIRWLVCLFDSQVIPVSFAGVTADRITRGHRFLGNEIVISNADQYELVLKDQFVDVDMDERQNKIRHQLLELEKQNGWHIPIDLELLEEVTQLVEYPTVVSGQFETEYLELPKEVLITTMREHQRYFPVQDQSGTLLPYFVTIRNGDKNALRYVSQGNEKVLRARLADAQFFYLEDQKWSIENAKQKLEHIVYQEALGSMADRVERGRKLALALGELTGLSKEEREHLLRASSIAKFDQVTQMIGEFPELEGYMGREYALLQGENPKVAQALYEQVLPRHAEDELPTSRIGAILALADRFDSLVSGFGIGLSVSGSQDPYGFRKKAAVVVQLLLHHDTLNLSLTKCIDLALEVVEESGKLIHPKSEVKAELQEFFGLRLKALLTESAIRYDVIDAVLASEIDNLPFVLQKASVLMECVQHNHFKSETEGFIRVANLATKGNQHTVDRALLEASEEIKLYEAWSIASEEAKQAQNAMEVYKALSRMVPSIHSFFDHVMVMVDREEIKENRLALLKNIDQLVKSFAVFDSIVFEGE
ncbi:glycine--tRNA ligase subunit beta [Shimazuella kribbensis]|uniref:glycine--tRNA ligase subunit beta n=1 Tax=Shimazuella kribbensis TaxID=139808 RepID=UPI0003F4FBCC|nr:glycine--tRNA ligase subunit beta [Shimazuella kribbensis]